MAQISTDLRASQYINTRYIDRLVLAEDPPALWVIYLVKYFQKFIYFIWGSIAFSFKFDSTLVLELLGDKQNQYNSYIYQINCNCVDILIINEY